MHIQMVVHKCINTYLYMLLDTYMHKQLFMNTYKH